MRVTIEGVAGAVPAGGSLVDLGCGGGQLCLHAARLGWKVTGVDVAEGMIEEARRLCEGTDVELLVAPYDENGLPGERVRRGDGARPDRVPRRRRRAAARGLAPAPLRRPLRRSCRNRLYNVSSLNDYTLAEAERGAVGELAGELATTLRGTDREALSRLAPSLAEAAARARGGDAPGREHPPPDLLDHPARVRGGSAASTRRPSSPTRREGAGLRLVGIKALHPHPLPAALEPVAPRFYNRLALAFQRPLEDSPLGLATASSFVAVFEKI